MIFVVFEFSFPIFSVFSRDSIYTFVTVPEAAVDENGDLLLKKDKVGVAFDIVVATPACNAVFLEDLDEFQLRGFVVLGTDVAHYLAAFFCGENVGHRC